MQHPEWGGGMGYRRLVRLLVWELHGMYSYYRMERCPARGDFDIVQWIGLCVAVCRVSTNADLLFLDRLRASRSHWAALLS